MKSSTRLHSVVFQLTPTRTRCDLLITANGKTEKLATGLLNPFLAHLKTAQEQVQKGGYSIILKLEANDNADWFTKGTIERFVRFVSNPEVLERVYTLETEIIQIKEAIGIQNNNENVSKVVGDELRTKRAESMEGSSPSLQLNEEKAIVLYEPDSHPKQANRSTRSDENSKAQVLKVLETRKMVLQKEQGMAFARAEAAGFDIDDMVPLISFAETFGASRLMDACSKFMELWKKKHETGQWVEIEAKEVMATQSNISAVNDSGIILANDANMRRNSWPGTTENSDMKSPTDNKPNVNREYVQGQHPQPIYAPWPVHSPPGTFPVFQGMPYYPNYPGASPYPSPSPYPSTDDSRRSSSQRKTHKHHSSSSSEDSEEEDKEKEKSSRRRKKSGKVVIRNINYINSKKNEHSETESEANEEAAKEECYNGKERVSRKTEAETGDWQAFQTFLLQDTDKNDRTIDHIMEQETSGKKKKHGTGKYDPLAYDEREGEKRQERDITDIQNGTARSKRSGFSDNSIMVHRRENGLENSSNPLNLNGFDKRSSVNMNSDDSYIVTHRSEAGSNNRNAIDMRTSEISSSRHETDQKKVNYEPHDLTLRRERETEKLSAGYDPTLDFESNALKKKKINQETTRGVKKSVKDSKSRLSNEDKRKASSGPIRKGRVTKMSPLDEAKVRADKLRSFKADLMKLKKEKEEEDRKRIENLKLERQKRIASKTNSVANRSTQQTRKPMSALRSSKFSDTEPSSLSPLQRRLPIRSASLGSSNDSQKFPKNGKSSSGSKLTRSTSPFPPSNRLTRSISPLPLSKRETRVSLDPQNKPTRRLSEPKIGSSSSVRSRRTIAPKRVSDGPEIKKLSAIVNYDIAKIASLPELKIKPMKGTDNVRLKGTEPSRSKKLNDADETPVIEKTVVMVLPSTDQSKQENSTTRAASVDKESMETTMQENSNDLVLVRLETLSDLVTETPKFLTNQNVIEKPYEAPYARVSSLEDHSQPTARSLQSNETQQETVPEKISEVLEKSQTKESGSKGFRKLLKFGKKNQTESSNEDHQVALTNTATSEAFTLKSLISQDETPTAAAAASQKSSRHFSLLSPFKNKKIAS